MRAVVILFALLIAFLVLKSVQVAGRVEQLAGTPAAVADDQQLAPAVARLNAEFQKQWQAENVQVVDTVDDFAVLRRLSLAMFGTVPSLEDIRAFEADDQPNRIDRWVVKMLQDSRYSDYFAERLARSLVGVEDGPFIVFRRDQMKAWLAQQLHKDASWSQMTKELIAAEGLWTDRPAANFITVARMEDEGLNVNKLAGRTVRTFLGQRIDCAQCHDHPFDTEWQQADFEGLAAFYCQAALSPGGVTDYRTDKDKQEVVYKVVDPGAETGRVVPSAVPFHPEWLPAEGGLRQRLAEWVTHKDNRRFERAIANRVWGFMLGKPLHEPVDDLPHPVDGEIDALDILGQEFRARGDRLSVLIRMIAMSDVYRLSSESNADSEEAYAKQVQAWAVFPLVRLRPEQVIGSLFQAGHIRSIDQNSNPFVRVTKFGNENDFLNEYGDLGDDELLQQVGTIPQALLRMNGRFTAEQSKVDALSAPAQILNFSPDNAAVIDNCFLACLCRHPAVDERTYFLGLLEATSEAAEEKRKANPEAPAASPDSKPTRTRAQVVEDLMWTLFNSPEFSWNH
ncbi:MAG: DUF1549 domain-containing protein [Fuerstia sp.]|nr:DUF1549 domain-containing protein [Fuerstiella sp.]